MAKDLVKLAFIFAVVFSVLSPTIDVTKAEIAEKRDLKFLSDGEIVVATNEAPSRRYGPLIRQPNFSGQDASVRGSVMDKCSFKIEVKDCATCGYECGNFWSCRYDGCEVAYDGLRVCYCYCQHCDEGRLL